MEETPRGGGGGGRTDPSPRKTILRWMKKLKSMLEKKNKKVERERLLVDLDSTCDGRDSSSTIASGLDESEGRLHEVLERRQQERIKELEAALKCAEKKFREKEMEVLMWKDTASVIQHCTVPKYSKSKQESIKGWEELEAELEAELECLLLQSDGEGFSKYSQHHNAKMVVEDTGSSSKIDPEEVPVDVWNGVHPIELERRLHEVLQCSQQERIKELEVALKCAENKLREKEMEVLMWKDTTSIIQHCTDPKYSKSKQESIKGWEELEAELEAELECLLLQPDGKGFSKYSQHHNAKMVVEDTGSSSIIDLGEVLVDVRNGVLPIELERRLYEVLECSQQERIKELEAALKCVENNLREKEMEVLMWKDAASVIQHCTDP